MYTVDVTRMLTEVKDDSCCVTSPRRVQLNCSMRYTTPIAAATSEGTRRRKVVNGEFTATKLGPVERGDIWDTIMCGGDLCLSWKRGKKHKFTRITNNC